MKKDKFFAAVYCPPYPPKGAYPDRLTKGTYSLLKEIGIDNVFGHFEDGYGENYLHKAMGICDELGLAYFPRLQVFNRYLAITGGYQVKNGVSYASLSAEERAAVDSEFLKRLEAVSAHDCFGGIYFGDEGSYDAIDAIAVAKGLFKEKYPNKAFHYNNLNYCFSDENLFGGVRTAGYKTLTGELSCAAENRFRRYHYLIDRYVQTVHPEYLTTDFYPFTWCWRTIPTSVHRGLYELNGFIAEQKKKEREMKSFHYMQLGCLETPETLRVTTRAELALQMNITLAYGHEGFAFFPGVYPNDFLGECEYGKGGICGLIDAYGRKTMYADMTKELLSEIQPFAPVLLRSEFLGVTTVGAFHGGFDGVDLSALPDNDCIYTGGTPDFVRYEGALPKISTDSQIFIGVFRQQNGRNAYYLVNNSVVSALCAKIELNGSFSLLQAAREDVCDNEVELRLPAGESALIY